MMIKICAGETPKKEATDGGVQATFPRCFVAYPSIFFLSHFFSRSFFLFFFSIPPLVWNALDESFRSFPHSLSMSNIGEDTHSNG